MVGRPVSTCTGMNRQTPRGYWRGRAWFGVPRWVVFLLSLKGCKGRLVSAAGDAEKEEAPLLTFFSKKSLHTHHLANTMSSFRFITVLIRLVGRSVNRWGDIMGRGENGRTGDVAEAMVGGSRDISFCIFIPPPLPLHFPSTLSLPLSLYFYFCAP